jgi:hypothetical protein
MAIPSAMSQRNRVHCTRGARRRFQSSFASTSNGLGFFRRTLRASKIAAQDRRIPTWIHGLAALGLLPIDEAVLLIAGVPLALSSRSLAAIRASAGVSEGNWKLLTPNAHAA